jgi:cytochrome P450
MEAQVRDLLSGESKEIKEASHRTLFTDILASGLPPEELTMLRLQNEAVSVIGAGFETTRWSLTVASYYILANPSVYQTLRDELIAAIPDPSKILAWGELQQLPYLSACIEEGGYYSKPEGWI